MPGALCTFHPIWHYPEDGREGWDSGLKTLHHWRAGLKQQRDRCQCISPDPDLDCEPLAGRDPASLHPRVPGWRLEVGQRGKLPNRLAAEVGEALPHPYPSMQRPCKGAVSGLTVDILKELDLHGCFLVLKCTVWGFGGIAYSGQIRMTQGWSRVHRSI